MPKENVSIFEIFGPVMIGPSSSHTAGVSRIAYLTRKMFGHKPDRALVRFFGSFATTWRGHGSDKAVIAGLYGVSPQDERLCDFMKLLSDVHAVGDDFPVELLTEPELPATWHPNTLTIELEAVPKLRQHVRASSIGGGSIRIDEIDGYALNLCGELDALLVHHHDEIGVIAFVARLLAESHINIASTVSIRKERGDEALLVVETDGAISSSILERLEARPSIYRVLRVPPLERL